jgi:hypothetical protein
MERNYAELTKRVSGDIRKLRKDIPDTMQAFLPVAPCRVFLDVFSPWSAGVAS